MIRLRGESEGQVRSVCVKHKRWARNVENLLRNSHLIDNPVVSGKDSSRVLDTLGLTGEGEFKINGEAVRHAPAHDLVQEVLPENGFPHMMNGEKPSLATLAICALNLIETGKPTIRLDTEEEHIERQERKRKKRHEKKRRWWKERHGSGVAYKYGNRSHIHHADSLA